MKAFFTSSAVSSSSGNAEQPAIISALAGSSAEQPSREAAQSVKAAVSSSSGSAEQPAIINSLAGSSAEQPGTPSRLKLSSIRDVQRWMAEESIASSTAQR